MTNMCKIELYDELDNEVYLNQIWEMVKKYDKTFRPRLADRDSVIKYNLIESTDDDREPITFYEDLRNFSFVLYTEEGEVKSFLAFKKGYRLSTLKHIIKEEDVNNAMYVAFSLVQDVYRSQGLFQVMNSFLESYHRKSFKYVTRRISSSNLAMINSLTRKNNYSIGNVIENDRGYDVHTISLYKFLT